MKAGKGPPLTHVFFSICETCSASDERGAVQLWHWIRERGIEPPELSCLPLRVAASEPMAGFVPMQLSPHVDPPIRLELRKGAAVITGGCPASSVAACSARLREWFG